MKTSLNILPYSVRVRQMVRLRLLQWFPIWILAAGSAIGIFYWVKYVPYNARMEALQTHERECEPLRQLQEELVAMSAQLEEVRNRETLALSLANDVPALTLLGHVSRAAHRSGGSVHVKQMSLDRETTRTASDTDSDSAGQTSNGMMTLRGAAVDNLSVARLMAGLRDSGVFDTVELKSTGIDDAGGVEARSYILECVF